MVASPMRRIRLTLSLPDFDKYEEKIVKELVSSRGGAFRTELRPRMGGSNTTFIKKISSLKEKGILEETKERSLGKGRLKTFYKLTEFAKYLFDLKGLLETNGWFTASHKVELFPEFKDVLQTISGGTWSAYRSLNMGAKHVIIETLLATKRKPELEDRELRRLLIMCSAFLQNAIADKLHSNLRDHMEGYLIFHYKLYRPNEQYTALAEYTVSYVKTENPLIQHKNASRIVELIINYPELSMPFTMMALKVALSMRLDEEAKALLRSFKSYKRREEPIQLTRIQLVISVLNIFKKLYAVYKEKEWSINERLELEM